MKSSRIRLSPRQKEIFADIAKYTLYSLIGGVALAIFLTDPRSIHNLLKKLARAKKNADPGDIERIYEKLRKDRFIELYSKNDKEYVKITEKGRRQLVEFNIDAIEIKRQKWDGKWRVVIFDIPEKYRLARNVLRQKLKDIGFIMIQKSVWVCPYECQNEISFIASTYEIERYVNYLVTSEIDINESLREKFDL